MKVRATRLLVLILAVVFIVAVVVSLGLYG